MIKNKLQAIVLAVGVVILAVSGMAGRADAQRTSTPPNWAQGTFYGRNPQDGGQIVLTISSDGRVTANIGGLTNYGTYYRGAININGETSRISQAGNGIRTTNNGNGEAIDYSRTSWNGGGGNDGVWSGGGRASSPPTWARGTFYARSPQDGSQIELTIENNGRVTANIGGSPTYGSYYRGNININGAVANVTQTRNGIRTTRTDNGEVINYRRNPGGGYGGGAGGGTGYGGNVPNWAIGSFTARNPQTGGNIVMTIDNRGRVTVNMEGILSYGTVNGTLLNIDGATASISQRGNGLRTTRTDNGERIDYRRY